MNNSTALALHRVEMVAEPI